MKKTIVKGYPEQYKDMMNQVKQTYIRYPLYKCSACIIETQRYIVLQSYNTIVAFIDCDGEADTVHDILTLEYGKRTTTSSQHINKFAKKYSAATIIQHE